MGGGAWTRETYDRVTANKVRSGKAFSYTRDAIRSGRYEAHDGLKVLDKDGRPFTRESRDSEEHPESTPIVIGFDVTGSMGDNPQILQQALKGLFGMLVRKGVASDPQVAIAGYGDTECDRVPLQLSQFESDNRIDDNLDNVFVERGGGGNRGEMSTALAWFVANHVETDAWQKRGKRGYMFLIGDECALPVSRGESHRFLGENQPHEITPEEAFAAAREKWDTYFLLVDNYAARFQHSRKKYARLLGEDHVIVLETTESAPAVIASVIGMAEETVDAGTLATDLVDAGFDLAVAKAATKATNGLDRRGAARGGEMAKADTGYADLGL